MKRGAISAWEKNAVPGRVTDIIKKGADVNNEYLFATKMIMAII